VGSRGQKNPALVQLSFIGVWRYENEYREKLRERQRGGWDLKGGKKPATNDTTYRRGLRNKKIRGH